MATSKKKPTSKKKAAPKAKPKSKPKKRLRAAPNSLAERVFRRHLNELKAHVEKNGVRGLRALYAETRDEIAQRLARFGAGDMRVEPATLRAQLAQVDAALVRMGENLRSHLADTAQSAAELGVEHATTEFKILEKRFKGTEPTLAVAPAVRFRGLVPGVDPSLLRRHRLQTQTWTLDTIKTVERQLSTSVLAQKPLFDVVSDVTQAIADERWKAERIVRTEMTYAHQNAKHEEMESLGATHKRLVETFDVRTGDDSFLIHGQTVPIGEAFSYKVFRKKTGAWKTILFQHPPNRPNDRATVIPWDPDWDENELERPLTRAELQAAPPTRWRKTPGVRIPPGHKPGRPYR